jgi:hypothetical protein
VAVSSQNTANAPRTSASEDEAKIAKPGAADSSEDTAKAPKTSVSEGEAKVPKLAVPAEKSPTAAGIVSEIVKVAVALNAHLGATAAAQKSIELAGIKGLAAGEMPATIVLTEAGAWAASALGVGQAFVSGFLLGNLIVDAFPSVGSAPAEYLYEHPQPFVPARYKGR